MYRVSWKQVETKCLKYTISLVNGLERGASPTHVKPVRFRLEVDRVLPHPAFHHFESAEALLSCWLFLSSVLFLCTGVMLESPRQ